MGDLAKHCKNSEEAAINAAYSGRIDSARNSSQSALLSWNQHFGSVLAHRFGLTDKREYPIDSIDQFTGCSSCPQVQVPGHIDR